MPDDFLLKAAFGCLPVITYLAILVHFDSFKLVRLNIVFTAIAAGAVGAEASYVVEVFLRDEVHLSLYDLMHFAAPLVEEFFTALIIIGLVLTNRVGFAFDAVILGFAAGAGFALVENFYFLAAPKDLELAAWVIRGFGSAIMHGVTTAVFALSAHLLAQHAGQARLVHFIPGLIFAVGLHTAFNYVFLDHTTATTIAMILALPAVAAALLNKDKKSIEDWLQVDFEAHKELLEKIRSGEYENLPSGRFLTKMHERFEAHVVDKMIYYIELHTELILEAESLLMAHAENKSVSVGKGTKEKLLLLHEIEEEIGKTGLLALRPHLNFSRHEFWEIYMLEKETGFFHSRAH